MAYFFAIAKKILILYIKAIQIMPTSFLFKIFVKNKTGDTIMTKLIELLHYSDRTVFGFEDYTGFGDNEMILFV